MRRESPRVIHVLCIVAALCVYAVSPSTASADEIRITGSTTFAPLVKAASEAFMAKRPDVKIVFTEKNASASIASVIDGNADLGCSARYISAAESDRASQKGKPLACQTVAMDSIVPIVHPMNKVGSLGAGQLNEIYTGKLAKWNIFGGGADAAIKVIRRESGSAMDEFWNEKVMSNDAVTPTAATLTSNAEIVKAVSEDPTAIGYTSYSSLTSQVKPLRLNGIDTSAPPSPYNPFSRKLLICASGNPSGSVQQFMDFLTGPEGKILLKSINYVPF